MRHHRSAVVVPGMKPRTLPPAGGPCDAVPHPTPPWSRREFLKAGAGSLALLATGGWPALGAPDKPVVSIARIRGGDVASAVEEAIDLLGGIGQVTKGKERILLKPNLVADGPRMTTKPDVVRTLATLMKGAGKEVSIGEGSAAAGGFNAQAGVIYRTRQRAILDPMQQHVFDDLGYSELARSLHVPLVNLHSGDLVEVPLARGYVFDRITLHRAVAETDLLVSVPMMKTHTLATVTLGMKNLIGLYPGTVYYAVRSWLHDHAAQAHSPGVAYEIVDMNRAARPGLVVIDASQAMEGNGPSDGDIVDMGLIIAGTNPLATDMVAAATMGIGPDEVPHFAAAWGTGMTPGTLADIEVRGAPIEAVRRPLKRPNVVPWTAINKFWGVQELTKPLS